MTRTSATLPDSDSLQARAAAAAATRDAARADARARRCDTNADKLVVQLKRVLDVDSDVSTVEFDGDDEWATVTVDGLRFSYRPEPSGRSNLHVEAAGRWHRVHELSDLHDALHYEPPAEAFEMPAPVDGAAMLVNALEHLGVLDYLAAAVAARIGGGGS